MATRVAPYGSWESPIKAEHTAQASVRLAEPWLDGESVYWSERRPAEGGRCVVKELGPAGLVERTPAPFNVRSRAHEYGGGAYCVAGSVLYFSDFSSGRIHRQAPGEVPAAITPELEATAYADFRIDQKRDRLIAVREQSIDGGEPSAAIVAIDVLGGSAPRVLVDGADFLSNPRISAQGTQLLWLSWSHPNMPWDGTELWVADLDQAAADQPASQGHSQLL